MAKTTFRIFKNTDSALVKALRSIAGDCGEQNTEVTFSIAEGNQKPIIEQLKNIENNKDLNKLLEANTSIFCRVRISFPTIPGSQINIAREPGSDNVEISFSDQLPTLTVAPLILAAHRHLHAYERTESIDKLLGNELAEFYRRREQGLLRLEDLTQKLIQQNEEYRNKIDTEYLKLKERLETENKETQNLLITEFNNRKQKLAEKETSLEQRAKELDDRSSKHARRQIRKDLKDELASRSQEFTLTEKTSAKRLPVHAIFIVLISVFSAFIILAIKAHVESSDILYKAIRLGLSSAAFAATAIFYIRWNDHWFRQHADEEFRLKRFELDIDRASWVVEMALEWKDEKGTEIPKELIDRLTRGLFSDQKDAKIPKHPSEELANALLSASTRLSLKIPGLGEASIDKKGIQKFKKAASEADKATDE